MSELKVTNFTSRLTRLPVSFEANAASGNVSIMFGTVTKEFNVLPNGTLWFAEKKRTAFWNCAAALFPTIQAEIVAGKPIDEISLFKDFPNAKITIRETLTAPSPDYPVSNIKLTRKNGNVVMQDGKPVYRISFVDLPGTTPDELITDTVDSGITKDAYSAQLAQAPLVVPVPAPAPVPVTPAVTAPVTPAANAVANAPIT